MWCESERCRSFSVKFDSGRASLLLLVGEAQVGALHLNPLLVNAVDWPFDKEGQFVVGTLQLLAPQSLEALDVSTVDGVFTAAPPPNFVQQMKAPELFRRHWVLTREESELTPLFGFSKQQRVVSQPVFLHHSFDVS